MPSTSISQRKSSNIPSFQLQPKPSTSTARREKALVLEDYRQSRVNTADTTGSISLHAKRDRYEQLLKDKLFMTLNPRIATTTRENK
jgi:hypothetical protein